MGERKTFDKTYDVFVGQIPVTATETDLCEHFEKYGHIASCSMFDSKRPGDCTKYGFLRFCEEEHAFQACAANGFPFQGSKIVVRFGEKKGGSVKSPMGRTPLDTDIQKGGWHPKPTPQTGGTGSSGSLGHSSGTGPAPPDNGVKEQWYVTQVDGPCMFWAQNAANHDQLVELAENLGCVCPSATSISGAPQINKIYAAKFSEDQQWYRCQVLEIVPDSKSRVLYIDFGNTEVIDNKEILDLPNSLASLKQMASKYVLYGLKPVYTDRNCAGFSQGKELLKSLIGDQLVNAVLSKPAVGKSGASIVPAIIEVGDIDVNQKMLDEGFGERRFVTAGLQSKRMDASGGFYPKQPQANTQLPMMSDRNQNQTPQPQLQNWNTTPPLDNLKGPRNVGSCWDSKTDSSFNRPQQPHNMSHAGHPVHPGHPGHPGHAGHAGGDVFPETEMFSPSSNQRLPNSTPPSHHQEAILQREMMDRRQEVDQMQHMMTIMQQQSKLDMDVIEKERNTALLELATLRGQVKLREQEMNKRLQEADLSSRLSTLMNGVSKIKLLRKQFPTDPDMRDNVECGVEMLLDATQVISLSNLDIITLVQTALGTYNSLQTQIKQCDSMEQAKDLVIERNEARRNIHSKLEEFDNVISGLPLEKRKKYRLTCLESLKDTHQRFLQCQAENNMDLKVALQLYQEWKNARRASFEESRTLTNTCHNELESALRQVQQNLSLDLHCSDGQRSSCCDFDNLLTRFFEAIQQEVSKTDMNRSEDVHFLTILVKALVTGLHKEMADIQCLLQYQHEWSIMKQHLSKWLEDVPDVSKLKHLRSMIKTLKSKLRHKLADKLDMEEEGENSGEEAEELQAILDDLRQQLHQNFLQEQDHLRELACLNEQHFPELVLQYPEFTIDNFTEFDGLVRIGWSLDHFSVKPLEGVEKKSVVEAMFNEEPVVLKEFIIDDGIGVKRGDFLRRAISYNSIKSEHLVHLSALFFVKSERQAYVQTPKYKCSLHQLLETCHSTLNPQAVQNILHGVLLAIETLHNANLVHGAVHPQNVFVYEDGNGILADFDFCRSLPQRLAKAYTTAEGLTFLPPEATIGIGNLTHAVDIFNFGLLTLLLTHPTGSFVSHGSGQFQLPESSHPVMNFLRQLLMEDAAKRPTASQLLAHPYFSTRSLSAKEQTEPDTLQLTRPKAPSPPLLRHAVGGGILKSSREPEGLVAETSDEQSLHIQDEDSDAEEKALISQEQLESTDATSQEQADNVSEEGNEGKEAIVTIVTEEEPQTACPSSVTSEVTELAANEDGVLQLPDICIQPPSPARSPEVQHKIEDAQPGPIDLGDPVHESTNISMDMPSLEDAETSLEASHYMDSATVDNIDDNDSQYSVGELDAAMLANEPSICNVSEENKEALPVEEDVQLE